MQFAYQSILGKLNFNNTRIYATLTFGAIYVGHEKWGLLNPPKDGKGEVWIMVSNVNPGWSIQIEFTASPID